MDPGTRTRHYKYTCPIAWGFTYADKIVPAAAGFTDVESSMEFEKSSVELSNMSCPQSTLDSNFAILLCCLCWGLYYWSDPKNYYAIYWKLLVLSDLYRKVLAINMQQPTNKPIINNSIINGKCVQINYIQKI